MVVFHISLYHHVQIVHSHHIQLLFVCITILYYNQWTLIIHILCFVKSIYTCHIYTMYTYFLVFPPTLNPVYIYITSSTLIFHIKYTYAHRATSSSPLFLHPWREIVFKPLPPNTLCKTTTVSVFELWNRQIIRKTHLMKMKLENCFFVLIDRYRYRSSYTYYMPQWKGLSRLVWSCHSPNVEYTTLSSF